MLSETQKHMARFHGDRDTRTRRSHLRRLRTSLAELRTDGVPAADCDTLRDAGRVLDRLLAALENDIHEARAIKRTWDTRLATATAALNTLPAESVADLVALAALAREIGSPRDLIERIEAYGWNYTARQLRRDALASLAHRCAGETGPVDLWTEKVRAALPAAADKNADLIRRINPLAVAEALHAASQPAGVNR